MPADDPFNFSQNKNKGRPITPIVDGFYTKPPTKRMKALKSLKNEGSSWQAIADELGDPKITPALLWKVAKGLQDSGRVAVALGHRKKRVQLNADLENEQQREALKRFAGSQNGMSWTEYCRWFADILLKMHNEAGLVELEQEKE